MFKLMGKEINATLGAQTILIWTHEIQFSEIHNYLEISTLYPLKYMMDSPIRIAKNSSEYKGLKGIY